MKLEPIYLKGEYWGLDYPAYNCFYRKIARTAPNRIDWIRPDLESMNYDYGQFYSRWGSLFDFVQRPWGNHLGWLLLEGWPIGDNGPGWWIS